VGVVAWKGFVLRREKGGKFCPTPAQMGGSDLRGHVWAGLCVWVLCWPDSTYILPYYTWHHKTHHGDDCHIWLPQKDNCSVSIQFFVNSVSNIDNIVKILTQLDVISSWPEDQWNSIEFSVNIRHVCKCTSCIYFSSLCIQHSWFESWTALFKYTWCGMYMWLISVLLCLGLAMHYE